MFSSLRTLLQSSACFLALATVTQVAVSMLQQGLAILSYALGAAARLSLAQTGTLVSANALGMMAAMLFAGPLIDRRGVRPVLAVSAVAEFAAAVLLVHQRSYAGLLAALALIGLSLGATPIAGARAIFERFAGPRRGLAMGIRQTGVPLGAAVAAAALPLWALRLGAFAPWLPLAGLALVLCLALAAVAPPVRRGGGAAPAAPLRRDLGRLALPGAISFLLAAGQYGLLTYTVASAPGGSSRALAGVLLGAAQIGGALGRIAFGHLSDRLRRRPEVVGCAALLGAGGIALSTRLGGLPLWIGVVVYLLAGAGALGWNALMLTWAGERVSAGRAASAISLGAAAVYAGAVAFPPLIGFAAVRSGFASAWLGISLVLLVAAALAFVGGRRARAR